MPDKDIELLADRERLQDAVHRYAWALDSRDWQSLRALFCDQVVFDYSSHSGSPAAEISADAWIGRLANARPGFDLTQHSLSNVAVRIAGATAEVRTYLRAEHQLAAAAPDDWVTLGGYYRFDFRREGEWKISGLKLTVAWNRGNRDLYRLAFSQA